MQSRSNLKSCVVVKQEGYVGEKQKCLAHQYVLTSQTFLEALPQPLLQT
jgi:hypothetical protein